MSMERRNKSVPILKMPLKENKSELVVSEKHWRANYFDHSIFVLIGALEINFWKELYISGESPSLGSDF